MCYVEKSTITIENKGVKKGQATYIAPLNLLPLLASAPGGLKGAGRIRLAPCKSSFFIQ